VRLATGQPSASGRRSASPLASDTRGRAGDLAPAVRGRRRAQRRHPRPRARPHSGHGSSPIDRAVGASPPRRPGRACDRAGWNAATRTAQPAAEPHDRTVHRG
jgi:hypothetical protein